MPGEDVVPAVGALRASAAEDAVPQIPFLRGRPRLSYGRAQKLYRRVYRRIARRVRLNDKIPA